MWVTLMRRYDSRVPCQLLSALIFCSTSVKVIGLTPLKSFITLIALPCLIVAGIHLFKIFNWLSYFPNHVRLFMLVSWNPFISIHDTVTAVVPWGIIYILLYVLRRLYESKRGNEGGHRQRTLIFCRRKQAGETWKMKKGGKCGTRRRSISANGQMVPWTDWSM